MSSGGSDHELYQYASTNRVRIEALEAEMGRTRDRLHEIETDRYTLRLLASKIDGVTTEVSELTKRLETLARRAVERPTIPAVQVFMQVVTTCVAVIALYLATRGG